MASSPQPLPSPATIYQQRYPDLQQQFTLHADYMQVLPNEFYQMDPSTEINPDIALPVISYIPRSKKQLEQSKLPFAVHYQPIKTDIQPVTRQPVRCKRCKAYINCYSELLNNKYVCNLCGRENELPMIMSEAVDSSLLKLKSGSEFPELQQQTVEYQVKQRIYLPATVDAAGISAQFLNPGESSHVLANVLSDTRNVDYQISKNSQNLKSSIMESGVDNQVPTSERLGSKLIPIKADFQNLSVQDLEEIDMKLPFYQILIIQVGFNSVYQGILGQTLLNIKAQLTKNPNQVIVPVFVQGQQILMFCNNQLLEIIPDPLTNECMLPQTVDKLQLQLKTLDRYMELVQKYFYEEIKEPTSQKFATDAAIIAAVSSLQRTGGLILAILCEGDTIDQSQFTFTNELNVLACKESNYYNDNSMILKLANEAMQHNIGISFIGLPSGGCNLNLNKYAPLVLKTGGQIYYNEVANFIKDIQQTGNSGFLQEVLTEIFNSQVIAVSFTVRCSQNVNVSLFENADEEVVGSLIGNSLGFLKQKLNIGQNSSNQTDFEYKTKDLVFGCFSKASDVEVVMPCYSRNQSLAVGLNYTQAFESQVDNAYLQMAFLYTHGDGSRRVRVNTLKMEITDQIAQVFNSCNQYALAAVLAKQCASRFLNQQAVSNGSQKFLQDMICRKPARLNQVSGEIKDQVELNLGENSQTGYLTAGQIKDIQSQINLLKTTDEHILLLKTGGAKMQHLFKQYTLVQKELVSILSAFRDLCGQKGQSRFLIPNSMQCLIVLVQGMGRLYCNVLHRGAGDGHWILPDARIAQCINILNMDSFQLARLLYPGIYKLTNSEVTGLAPYPLSTSARWINEAHRNLMVYTNGLQLYMHVGNSISDSDVQKLLGLEGQKQKYFEMSKSVFYVQKVSDQNVQKMIDHIKYLYNVKGGIYLSLTDGMLEPPRRWLLIEDAGVNGNTYQAFLGVIQDLVIKQ